MAKWEYMELKITHGQIEITEDDFRAAPPSKDQDPYDYIKKMVADGWTLVTRSGSLSGEFSVVLKRPVPE